MQPTASPALPPTGERLMSLDVFRGATIAAMMLVNNPGSWGAIYGPLRHAEWHGWTFTDLIFPFFLWIVGVAIPFSTAKRVERGEDRRKLFLHILRRSALLVLIGLLLSGFPFYKLESLRFPGVLQRIGVCYFCAATLVLFLRVRGLSVCIAALLIVYWLLMKLVPVPGFGAGDLSVEGNFAHYIDRLLLDGNMWSQTKTWDPEGIVSTLPAIATVLFGVLTGYLVRSTRPAAEKTAWMFVFGSALLVAGQMMNWWLPINKSLWTSSFSVFMAGMATNCFAVCYWLVDVQGWRGKLSKPLAIYGMNAITVFVLSGLLGRLTTLIKWETAEGATIALKTWLYQILFVPLGPPKFTSLLYAVMMVLLLYLVAWVMHRRKWFLKL